MKKLYIVGLGPGAETMMTAAARTAAQGTGAAGGGRRFAVCAVLYCRAAC